MIHQIVIRLIDLFPSLTSFMSHPTKLASYYAACIIISSITYEIIEKPFRKSITKISKRVIINKILDKQAQNAL